MIHTYCREGEGGERGGEWISEGFQKKPEWEEQRVKHGCCSNTIWTLQIHAADLSVHMSVYMFKWTVRLMSCQMIYNNPDMSLRMLLFRVSKVSWKGQTQGSFLNISTRMKPWAGNTMKDWSCSLYFQLVVDSGCVSESYGKTDELLFELCPLSLPVPYIVP